MRGLLFDALARKDQLELWILTSQRMRAIEVREPYSVYAKRTPEVEFSLNGIDLPFRLSCERRELLKPEPFDTLEIPIESPGLIRKTVSRIERATGFSADLYNADVAPEQVFLWKRGLFPTCEVEFETRDDGGVERLASIRNVDADSFDYELPKLREMRFKVRSTGKRLADGVPVKSIMANGESFEGSETEMLSQFAERYRSIDPDVVVTLNDEEYLIPYIVNRFKACGIPFNFGRAPDEFVVREGKSFWSYNRVVRRNPAYYFRGRWHINEASFLWGEGSLDGVVELSRVSTLPVQRMARLSPGNAITSMQMREAFLRGLLIPHKKNQHELFKTAREIYVADRGGMTFEPTVGFHTDVAELDYSSMYPSIMIHHNVSPETLNCACCEGGKNQVHGLCIHFCAHQEGLIPRVLAPAIARRLHYKKMKKLIGPLQLAYDRRCSALKWLGVVAFGYTGYRNARFGRIECHQAICAFSREKLLQAVRISERHGFRLLHGVTDSVYIQKKGLTRDELVEICKEIEAETGIPIAIENIYRWYAFSPSTVDGAPCPTRYFGVNLDGELKMRGIEQRRHDTPKLVKDVQVEMLNLLAHAGSETEFRAYIPQLLFLLKKKLDAIARNEVPLKDLLVYRELSKSADRYKANSPQRSAALQLESLGVPVHPGTGVEYVFAAKGGRAGYRNVLVKNLVNTETVPSVSDYEKLLVKATESLLAPVGWNKKMIRAALEGIEQTKLGAYTDEYSAG